MAAGKKRICIPSPKADRAPIITLFFLWRLHSAPRHGYSIIQDMRKVAIPLCKPSTVYALLAKLEKAGLVKSHYDESSAHARKMFQTTPKGWLLLQKVKKQKVRGLWREFITDLLHGPA